MYKVNLSKECGCVKKNGYGGTREYDSKDDALEEAQQLVQDMNEKFCKKHRFSLIEQGNDFLIQVIDNR